MVLQTVRSRWMMLPCLWHLRRAGSMEHQNCKMVMFRPDTLLMHEFEALRLSARDQEMKYSGMTVGEALGHNPLAEELWAVDRWWRRSPSPWRLWLLAAYACSNGWWHNCAQTSSTHRVINNSLAKRLWIRDRWVGECEQYEMYEPIRGKNRLFLNVRGTY